MRHFTPGTIQNDHASHRGCGFYERGGARSIKAGRAIDGGRSVPAERDVLVRRPGAELTGSASSRSGRQSGRKLSIWIDHARDRLLSRILTTDDCKFGDDGARCRLIFRRGSPDYRRFVAAFRRGRTAHVEVQNAAVMQMSTDLSLSGFTRKLGIVDT